MGQPTVNRFNKGLNSDISLTDVPREMFLDGHNIRLTRREEGSLWAANIRGNEETFELSDGFIPIGSKEFDGYLFIMSVRSSDGKCEVGSYPAPTSTGVQRLYRPLQNYSPTDIIIVPDDTCLVPTTGTLSSLRTSKLGFRCDKPIRMEIRLDFDGSVNIYYTDDNQPWRVINNGFVLSTGLPNGRYITASMIENGAINGINESESIPVINLNTLLSTGSLSIGNYFFFVRYTDLNYLSTSFLGQSGPIPIFNTSLLGSVITFGGEGTVITDKAVNLNISNLDITMNFFEVAYIRYFGDNIYEAKLIDIRYNISGLSSTTITISGNEPTIAITLDELVTFKPSDALYCKDLTQAQNILYLTNTYGPQLDHPDLRRFMCALELQETYTNNGPAPEVRNDININQYTVDANDTEETLGYFSGETYIFAGIPVFKGGFQGLPYPVTGFDNYTGVPLNANKQGIFRFSKAHVSPYWDGTDTFIKGIRLVVTASALAIYNASSWLQDHLIGFVMSRGERNENILYQGLTTRCYTGNMNPKLIREDAIINGSVLPTARAFALYEYEQTGSVPSPKNRTQFGYETNPEDWSSGRAIPLFEPATYGMMSFRHDYSAVARRIIYFYYAHPIEIPDRNNFTDQNRLGFFSTDYYIHRKKVPESCFVDLIGTTDYYNDWNRETTSLNPSPIFNRNTINGWEPSATSTISDIQEEEPLSVPDNTLYSTFDATQWVQINSSRRGRGQAFVGYNQLNINYQVDGFLTPTVNVTGWTVLPDQNFVSKMEEGKIASQDGLYYYERKISGTTDVRHFEVSLPVALPDYIGIVNAPNYNAPQYSYSSGNKYHHFEDKWDRAIVNICRTDPSLINYTEVYDFKNTEFYPIGTYQEIQSFITLASHDYYRGDCIVSRSYIKLINGHVDNIGQNFNDILSASIGQDGLLWDPGNSDQAINDFQNGYGHWVSMVTEQRFNSNYRHELGRNLFYPKSNPNNPGKDFAWITDSPESYFYNFGLSEYLGPRTNVGIDLLLSVSNNRFPTRIRPSITHVFGAIRDGYRQFIPANAKDFDYSFGEIQAIVSIMDMLYSFQNRAINLHPINERVTQQGTQGSTAVLGESSGLTQFRQIVKQGYGTQHRFGVVVANQAIYCIDWNKRAILRIAGQEVQILDINKSVQSWFRNIISLGSTGYSDVLEQLPNSHPCGRGIHGIYNKKYKEVLWTLRLGEEDKTIAFSEEMDCFLGTRGYKPIHYAQVEEDLYSFVDKKAWLHDANVKYNTFYGTLDNWLLKFAVNESAEITKHFDNLIINSNNRVFASIKFETQHQTANQTPFLPTVEFWYAPTYRENEWRLPIRRADNIKNTELNIYDDFTTDKTPMRGKYLIVELEYNQDKELWVREVITFFNQSFT